MKSRLVQQLLRILIAFVGSGIGAGIAMGLLQAVSITTPEEHMIPLGVVIGVYIGASLCFGIVFYLLGKRILHLCTRIGNAVERKLNEMPLHQLIASCCGLICGLLIAALLSQVIGFFGHSMFTVALSATLYVLLGTSGYSVGRRRSKDVGKILHHTAPADPSAHKDVPATAARPKLLDTSAIIDGRILSVVKTGLIEGEVIVPSFILSELQHVAESSDPVRRSRGRRGLDMLEKLKAAEGIVLRVDSGAASTDDTDVQLVRMAQQNGGMILTGDYALYKIASVAGVRVVNLNDLACALRPVVTAGEELTVRIIKEGREAGQGVAYLDDGTMIVVDGGRRYMDEQVTVTVTTTLQTSAGHMVFAKAKENN